MGLFVIKDSMLKVNIFLIALLMFVGNIFSVNYQLEFSDEFLKKYGHESNCIIFYENFLEYGGKKPHSIASTKVRHVKVAIKNGEFNTANDKNFKNVIVEIVINNHSKRQEISLSLKDCKVLISDSNKGFCTYPPAEMAFEASPNIYVGWASSSPFIKSDSQTIEDEACVVQ